MLTDQDGESQSSSQDSLFKDRWDRTNELGGDEDRWKRRLDSIARLLEGGTLCVALMIEGKGEQARFRIATNTAFVEKSESADYLLIVNTMEFFKTVAETGDDRNKDEMFRDICVGAARGLQISSFAKNELDLSFIKAAADKEFRHLKDFLSERREIGHVPADVGAAFVTYAALYRDFDKIIAYIKKRREAKPENLTDGDRNFLAAISKFSAEQIVKKSPLASAVKDKDEMHAEMRLIDSLGDKLRNSEPYENYIGLSKLCCLDCHLVIHAVNQETPKGQKWGKNALEIRGAHNVDCSKNWKPPLGMSGTPTSLRAAQLQSTSGGRSSRANVVEDAFTKNVVQIFQDMRATAGVKGVPQYANASQSERSQAGSQEQKEAFITKELSSRKEELEKAKGWLEPSLGPDHEKIKEISLALTILAEIEQSGELIPALLNRDSREGILIALATSCNGNAKPSEVQAILENPYFVGKLLAGEMRNLSLKRERSQSRGSVEQDPKRTNVEQGDRVSEASDALSNMNIDDDGSSFPASTLVFSEDSSKKSPGPSTSSPESGKVEKQDENKGSRPSSPT